MQLKVLDAAEEWAESPRIYKRRIPLLAATSTKDVITHQNYYNHEYGESTFTRNRNYVLTPIFRLRGLRRELQAVRIDNRIEISGQGPHLPFPLSILVH
jgi:hypothetical protein